MLQSTTCGIVALMILALILIRKEPKVKKSAFLGKNTAKICSFKNSFLVP